MTLQNLELSSVSIEQVTDTRVSGKRRYFRNRSRGYKKPYWMISMTTSLMPYAEGMGLAAYLDSLEGSLQIVNMPNPLPSLKPQTGISVFGTNNAGLNTIALEGFNSNEVDAVLAGDFLTVANHPKAYRITKTKDASFSGQVSVEITPPLFQNVFDGTAVTHGDIQFQVCLVESVPMEVNSNNGKHIMYNLEFMEQG